MAIIPGTAGNDNIDGTEGADIIEVGTGIDTVNAKGGNDIVRFTAEQHGGYDGFDDFNGGAGVDTLEFDFASEGSRTVIEVNVGTTIEGKIGIDNADSVHISGFEKLNSTFMLFEDQVFITLGASVSSDIYFDIDAGTVPGYYYIRDPLIILAQAWNSPLTLTSTDGIIQTSFGRFVNFEVLTVYGTEFGDTISGAGIVAPNSAIYGGGGNDNLTGTSGDDQLWGDAGDDIAHGGSGNDLLAGGDGIDQLYGEAGDDTFWISSLDAGDVFDGGEGKDYLYFVLKDAPAPVSLDLSAIWSGGTIPGSSVTFISVEGISPFEGTAFGDTFILGADAPDNGEYYFMNMGAGNDVVSGSHARDFIDGEEGNDQISGLGGDDTIYGGDGNDLINAGGGSDWVFGGNGNDRIYGLAGDDLLDGEAGDDRIEGGDGIDHIRGGLGVDILLGGEGDDVILVDGQDTADGGAGTDYLVIDMRDQTQGGTLDLGDSNRITGFEGVMLILGSNYDDTISIGNLTYVSPFYNTGYFWNLSNFEGIRAGGGNDYVVGGPTDDEINGEEGNDTLVTLAGNDKLYGGSGDDNLHGGSGNDTYYVDSQMDLVFEDAGGGTDSVYSTVSYYLYANVENLTLDVFSGSLFGVGNAVNNHIIGNTGDNLLLGGGGDDVLEGGPDGNDQLFGEDGNDVLNGGTGIDYLVGGSGNDILDGSYHPDALYGEDGDDILYGGEGFDTDILVGGAGNDILYGNSGQADYDLMNGGDGDDVYWVDTGDDLTFEAPGGGIDTVHANVPGVGNGVYLYPNVENLVLHESTAFGVGNELDNELTGSEFSNWLLGGAGDDVINGKNGYDVLFGEGGADIFVFERGTQGDVIGDFQHGVDRIDLSDFHFASFAQLANSFHQVGTIGAIDLGNDDLVVLFNVTMSSLNAADFIL